MTDMFIALKEMLSVEDKDVQIEFALQSAKNIVTDYCNIKEVPESLETTVVRMAMDIYRNEQPGETEKPQAVKSVSIGDTSTSFGDKESGDYTQSILKNYQKQLNRYRRLTFR